MQTSFIAGISGQDGAYLAKLLLEQGYQVIGLLRKNVDQNLSKLEYLEINDKIKYEICDLTDLNELSELLHFYHPSEFYNLAAQSSVARSFGDPLGTFDFNIKSVSNILEAIRLESPTTKFYQASSSEMFGHIQSLPIHEESILNPLSPYAISKASAHLMVKCYRQSYGLFACSGILFNHESFLRGDDFFIKKIIQGAIRIANGQQKELRVGNLNVKRDFGFAPDYVKAMHLMLQQNTASDFVICSGKSLFLQEIVEYIFNSFNIPFDRIIVDKDLFRPSEIIDIYGDNSKAKSILKWEYDKTFYQVLDILISQELNESQKNNI